MIIVNFQVSIPATLVGQVQEFLAQENANAEGVTLLEDCQKIESNEAYRPDVYDFINSQPVFFNRYAQHRREEVCRLDWGISLSEEQAEKFQVTGEQKRRYEGFLNLVLVTAAILENLAKEQQSLGSQFDRKTIKGHRFDNVRLTDRGANALLRLMQRPDAPEDPGDVFEEAIIVADGLNRLLDQGAQIHFGQDGVIIISEEGEEVQIDHPPTVFLN